MGEWGNVIEESQTPNPPRKKKKLEKLEGWGEHLADKSHQEDIDNWLYSNDHGRMVTTDISCPISCGDSLSVLRTNSKRKKKNMDEEPPKIQKKLTEKRMLDSAAKTCMKLTDMFKSE